MDIRTWQDADRIDDPRDAHDAGHHRPRHRAKRSPFSPLRPAPIAIGGVTTAAFAAVALVGPGGLQVPNSSGGDFQVEGLGPHIAPLIPGAGSVAVGAGTNVGTGTGAQAPAPPADSSAPGLSAPGSLTPTATATSVTLRTGHQAPPATSPRQPSGPTTAPSPTSPPPGQGQPPVVPPSAPPSGTTPPTVTSPTVPPATPPATPPVISTPTRTPPTTPPITPSVAFNAAAAQTAALNEITTARRAHGNGPLIVEHDLTTAAVMHTADMVRNHIFSHTGSDGSDPGWRAMETGCMTFSKEIIARGNPGDDIAAALLKDPTAGAALTSFWNQTIGVSAQQDPKTGQVVWTIELGWLP